MLIVALRFGHVYGTTIKDVLEHAGRRADRTVQWTHPKRPLLYQIPRGSAVTTLDDVAPEAQLSRTITQMGVAAGVLDRLTSHSVRYGAIRDTAHIKKAVAGLQENLAAIVAGHSKDSRNSGVTQMYIGGLQIAIYNIRAKEMFEYRLGPKFAVSPMRMRSNTTAEIEQYLGEY